MAAYATMSLEELQTTWENALANERAAMERRGRRPNELAVIRNADAKHPGLRQALVTAANR